MPCIAGTFATLDSIGFVGWFVSVKLLVMMYISSLYGTGTKVIRGEISTGFLGCNWNVLFGIMVDLIWTIRIQETIHFEAGNCG
ncbi:hypothetical protein RJT34_00705 [Clitoria ternatea]|uniref:Uncharacterized protein n=1 Tax=Clitoria ternatea TaxID=43366 RepID=A0AAN9KG42_CLITE